MSLINVDYNLLEKSKQNINIGISQCTSIASCISGVKGSIDGRVAARCSGLDGLISSFNSIADKLEMFYENLDNTIRDISQLDEEMNSGFDLATTLKHLSLLQQQGANTNDITVQLKTTEEMLDLINKTTFSLEEDIKNQDLSIIELKEDLNKVIESLLDKGYSSDEVQSNEEYIKLQKQIADETTKQQLLQEDLNNLNNLKIVFDYQKQDLQYQQTAKKTSDFLFNNDFESILNKDGTINKEVMDAINAYRRENNLTEITNEEEFNLIFGETTEEEWLQRAAISYDVFSAVNPLMVANAVNKNNYEVGVDMDNYLLADTYLTEEEKETFNYYYNTGGKLKADEYLNFKLGELNTRKQNEQNQIHQEKYNEYLSLGEKGNYDDLSIRYYDRTLNLPEHLTEEEKQAAIYLYKTEGLSKYDEFIDFLDVDLKQREARIEADKEIEDFVNSGIFRGIKIGATGFGDGVLNFFEGLKNATIKGADGEVSVNQLKSQYILEALMTDSRFTPYLDQGIYEISMGIGNMAPSIATSALVSTLTGNPLLGAKVGTTLMGVSSGGNSYESALMSGASQSQALLYGILSGSSEATLGYFLGNIPGLSKESSSTLLGLLKEGGEEASQEILDSILRNQIYGEELVINFDDVVKSGAYGIITSGILNGGTLVYNNTKLKGYELVQDLKKNVDVSLLSDLQYLKINLELFTKNMNLSLEFDQGKINELYLEKKAIELINNNSNNKKINSSEILQTLEKMNFNSKLLDNEEYQNIILELLVRNHGVRLSNDLSREISFKKHALEFIYENNPSLEISKINISQILSDINFDVFYDNQQYRNIVLDIITEKIKIPSDINQENLRFSIFKKEILQSFNDGVFEKKYSSSKILETLNGIPINQKALDDVNYQIIVGEIISTFISKDFLDIENLSYLHYKKKMLEYVNDEMLDSFRREFPFMTELEILSLKGTVIPMSHPEFENTFKETAEGALGINVGHYSWIDLSIGMLEKYKGLPLPKNFDPFTVAKSVATHESIHKLVHARRKKISDGVYIDGFQRGTDVHVGINEVVTELLTEKIMEKNYPTILFNGYQYACYQFKRLIDSGFISYEKLKYANLNSDDQYLPKIFWEKTVSTYHNDSFPTAFAEFSKLMDMSTSSNPYEKQKGFILLEQFITNLLKDDSIENLYSVIPK